MSRGAVCPARFRHNDLLAATAKRQRKKDADILAQQDVLITSLCEQLHEIAACSKDRGSVREEARELAVKVRRRTRPGRLEDLHKEFVRARRRKLIVLGRREGPGQSCTQEGGCPATSTRTRTRTDKGSPSAISSQTGAVQLEVTGRTY